MVVGGSESKMRRGMMRLYGGLEGEREICKCKWAALIWTYGNPKAHKFM